MPRVTNKSQAKLVRDLWKRSDNGTRTKWRSANQKGHDFFLNDQLTAGERKQIEEAGMPTFIINLTTSKIEIMKYFATANDPRWQGVGAEGSDIDTAAVHSDLAAYCWHLSGGKSLFSQVIQDSLTKSVGYFHCYIDSDADRGMGEVMFRSIEPWDVYVDPMSRDFLFRDAAYIIVKKDMPREHLKLLYPAYKAKISKANSDLAGVRSHSARDVGESDSIQYEDVGFQALNPKTAEEDDILDVYEMYTRESIPFFNIFRIMPPTIEEMRQIQAQVEKAIVAFRREVGVSTEEKLLAIQEQLQREEIIPERAELESEKLVQQAEQAIEQKQAQIYESLEKKFSKVENVVATRKEYEDVLSSDKKFVESIVDIVEYFEQRIKVTMVVGDQMLYAIFLDNSNYPIVPIPYIHTGTPYSMSAVIPMVGKQQEINKSHQIMVHNANLASNVRWIMQEGSINEAEWESNSTMPDAKLKYRMGYERPQPVFPLPLSSAFADMVQMGKADMEDISGIQARMQGQGTGSSEPYRGLLAIDEYSTRRIKEWMKSMVEPALEHLGNVFLETARATYTAKKVFRIVQPGAGDGDGLDERQLALNVPIYNDLGKEINKMFDYASARFDVRYIAGSTLPVNRHALRDEYFRYYQSGLIDDVAMIAETDIRNKEELLKRKSVYSELKEQSARLEAMVKDRDGVIETLSRQLVQADIKDQSRTAGLEIRKDVLETEAQQKLYRKEQQERKKSKEKT